ncbi:MAG: TIGR03986 family CRISPR-associated RAMP protein [Proteobacteria bacterium]|nr:MAG: TIGR03986 family CRISPR-associated RAMP protein [Pseudomonadota bacterium]
MPDYPEVNTVHAPYHFVPLSRWVYMPDWAHLVSHDVPFKEGYSGIIEYRLTNSTPLCVGAEQEKKADRTTLVKWARDPVGNPVIPGSSVKGMIRNVLEIASFGKFNAVDNQQFSFRDLSSAKNHYLHDIIGKSRVEPGWIKYDNSQQKWIYTGCDCAKVKHQDIKDSLKVSIKNEDPAEEKYRKLPLSRTFTANISDEEGKQKNRWARSLQQGNTRGQFVFTNNRIKGRGKPGDYEFSYFFFNKRDRPTSDQIDRQVSALFSNHRPEQVKYLQGNFCPTNGIPVFALTDKSGNRIEAFGFAKMPRASYKHTVQDLIDRATKNHRSEAFFDLAELIFGTIRDNGLGLKSRVIFSDATADNLSEPQLYLSSTLILNNPKPTFYPAYLEQKSPNEYNTYDSDTTPAGWKRYISRKPDSGKLISNATGKNANVSSRMELAPVNSQFTGKIVFHNLNPVELGALLWSIELSGDERYHHQLGHGKPFGAGSVRLSARISKLHGNTQTTQATQPDVAWFRDCFVRQMTDSYPETESHKWQDSPQIANLLAMSNLNDNQDVNTRYMSIDSKDFQRAKNNNLRLESFNSLHRAEPGRFARHHVPLSFGEGRLGDLVDATSSRDQELLGRKAEAKEARQKQADEQKAIAERQARMASLSPCGQILLELEEKLAASQQNDIPPLIREAMATFLSDDNAFKSESAMQLYKLARKYEYHKKPKKKVAANKAELNSLKEKYKLEL